MKFFKTIENEIEYEAVECCGPLEYVDAKCFVFDNKDKKCIIFYNQNSMYGNTSSGGIATLQYKEYYKNRELHRDNGPAIEFVNNPDKSKYYLNGVPLKLKEYKIHLRKYKIKKLNEISIL